MRHGSLSLLRRHPKKLRRKLSKESSRHRRCLLLFPGGLSTLQTLFQVQSALGCAGQRRRLAKRHEEVIQNEQATKKIPGNTVLAGLLSLWG